MDELEKVDKLLDLCFDRSYNIPDPIREYLYGRLADLTDVCKE